MTAPITGLELRIGTEGVVRGRDEWVRSMQALQASARQTQQELRSFQLESQRVISQQAGMTTAAATVATSFQTVSTASSATLASLQRLRGPLVALTAQLTGTQGPLASLVSQLGVLTAGAPLTLGVTAGIAAIALALRSLRGGSQAATDDLKALTDRAQALAAQERRQTGRDLEVDLDVLTALLAKARAEHDRTAQVAQAQEEFFGRIPRATRQALEEAGRLVAQYQDQVAVIQRAVDRRDEERAEAERRAVEAADRAREAAHRREQERIREQQRQWNAYVEALRRFDDPRGRVLDTRGRVSSPAEEETRAVQRYREALAALKQDVEIVEVSARKLATAIRAIDAGRAERERARREETEALVHQVQLQLQLAEAIGDGARRMIELVAGAGGFGDELARALRGVTEIVQAVPTIQATLRLRAQRDASGNPLASAGQLVGSFVPLVGGLAGLLGGFLGGGPDQARLRELRQEFERAARAFADIGKTFSDLERSLRGVAESFGDLVRQRIEAAGFTVGRLDTPEAIDQAIAALQKLATVSKRFSSSQREAAEQAVRDIETLKRQRADVEARLRAEAEAALGRVQEDLQVRRLLAEGRDAEAEALRRQHAQTRELLELRQRFGDLLTDEIAAELARVHALEREAEALRRATEESRKRREIALSLDLRELAAGAVLRPGDADEAEQAIRRLEREAELQRAIEQGYTAAELARLAYIHGLEAEGEALARAQAAQARAARETEALADFEIRRLRATDRDEAAEELTRALHHQQELARAVAEGWSEATLATLQAVQALEDEKRARDAAAAALARQVELLQQEARAQEDLAVRRLRAQGLAAAADELAFLQAQRRELAEAQAKGFSAELLDSLRAVQAEERAWRREQDALRQQEAFAKAADAAFGLSTPTFAASRPSVSLGIGTSEATSNRIAGLMQAMVVQLAHLPGMAADFRIVRRLLERRAGGGVVDLDAILGEAAVIEDRRFGILPGNLG